MTSGQRVDATSYETGSWAPAGPVQRMPHIVQFTTPSGNIRCTMTPSLPSELMCSVEHYDFAPPVRPASCRLNWSASLLDLTNEAAELGRCVGDAQVTYSSNVLTYGSVIRAHGFSCYSGSAALTCLNTDGGHGFSVSKASLHTF